MGNRFGRRQRRQAREKIARLEADRDRLVHEAGYYIGQIDGHRRRLKELNAPIEALQGEMRSKIEWLLKQSAERLAERNELYLTEVAEKIAQSTMLSVRIHPFGGPDGQEVTIWSLRTEPVDFHFAFEVA